MTSNSIYCQICGSNRTEIQEITKDNITRKTWACKTCGMIEVDKQY